ncbi:rod shape-determining protein MreD [Enterococcus faecalis]
MIRKEQMRYVAPIIFFFLLLIDAHLTKAFETWTDNSYFANAHLLLLALLFAVPNFSKRYLLITSLILGLLADSYFIGIIGIYTVALTTTVILMFMFRDVVQTNLLTGFFGIVIFVSIYEFIAMILQVIFHLANVNPLLFITEVLGPTLLLNMVLFVLLAYPFKKLFTSKK